MYIQVERDVVYADIAGCIPAVGSPSIIFVCSKAPWLRHRYAECQYNMIQDMITTRVPMFDQGIEHICNEEDCYEDTHLLQKGWIR